MHSAWMENACITLSIQCHTPRSLNGLPSPHYQRIQSTTIQRRDSWQTNSSPCSTHSSLHSTHNPPHIRNSSKVSQDMRPNILDPSFVSVVPVVDILVGTASEEEGLAGNRHTEAGHCYFVREVVCASSWYYSNVLGLWRVLRLAILRLTSTLVVTLG